MSVPTPDRSNAVLYYIMLAVAVWGGLLSLGAFIFGRDASNTITFAPNPVRGLIVLACVSAFLGSWIVLLAMLRRRQERRFRETPDAEILDDNDDLDDAHPQGKSEHDRPYSTKR